MRRRWAAGWNGEFYGLQFRIVPGDKKGRALPDETPEEDLRLEWFIGGVWIPIRMAVGFFLADFFYENEEALYPQRLNFEGGKKYLRGSRMAALDGWETAQRWLEMERDYTPTLFDETRMP